MYSRLLRLAKSGGVHALLIYGGEGYGQEQAAREVAATWLCDSPGETGACGVCGSCGAFARENHSDVQIYRPTGSSNIIRNGQIRQDPVWKDCPNIPVLDFARTMPMRSRYKVAIFDQADRMNVGASNALLKTLEEPPSYFKFVLTTSVIGKLLATIRSRCVCYAMSAPSDEHYRKYGEATEWAKEIPHLAPLLFASPEDQKATSDFIRRLGSTPQGGALKLSEDFKLFVDRMSASDDSNARNSLARALEALAAGVARAYPDRPDRVDAIVLAHQRAIGNGNPGLVLDSLFLQLLG